MDEIKKALHKFKEAHKKIKHIKFLQKQVKTYSKLVKEIKNAYIIETDIEVKRKLLISEYHLIESAQINNNKVGECLEKLKIYIR